MEFTSKIELRLKRAQQYLEYVKSIEEVGIVEGKRVGLPDLWTEGIVAKQIWPQFVDHEMARVLSSAKRTADAVAERKFKRAAPRLAFTACVCD